MSTVVVDALGRLSQGTSLSQSEAYALMDAIMRGEATPAQLGGVLMALAVRGESIEELTGFALAMRDHAAVVPLKQRPVMDTCGTGGDRSFTFNVSTVSAFVVASAGVHVAKHGNRSATSKSGSADLLEALGIPLLSDPNAVGQLIDEEGFGFLFAQSVHGSMRHAGPTRRELGVRTVFNVLGPLTNPCRPDYQLLGVYAPHWVEPMAQVLVRLGTRRAMVVHGHGGLDEVSLSGPTQYGLVDGERVCTGTVTPEALGLPLYPVGSWVGGDPALNAEICRQILAGQAPGPWTDLVLANAGTALYIAERAQTLRDGVELAREVINQGLAWRLVSRLVERTSGREHRRDA